MAERAQDLTGQRFGRLLVVGRAPDRNGKGYGGRGITVSPVWRSFLAFLENLGERPIGTTLDRIKAKPLSEWAELLGLSRSVLNMRIRHGWTVERALETTVAFRKNRELKLTTGAGR